MKRLIFLLLFFGLMATAMRAEDFKKLSLPRQEQLSSDRVQQVLQDSEGYLWYATEGGGVCRDDGRQISVFRSDTEHPDLLGSNDVVCLAEAGSRIIIGTFHGAYTLDKQDYTIRRLTDVDDKHVDDIITAADGHWWLTSNKKVYEFDGDGNLLNTYPTGDKYVARIHEDRQGHLWISQWDGGLMTLRDGQFTPVPWSVDAAPSAIIDDPAGDGLLIGTIGQGIVRYLPADGSLEILEQTGRSVCIDMKVTNNHLWMNTTGGLQHFIVGDWMEAAPIDTTMTTLRRLTLDKHGNLLVANNEEESFALSWHPLQPWYSETPLTRFVADSIRASRQLSARPTALAMDTADGLWFSTGRDIRIMKNGKEDVVLPDTKDVSAMTFDDNGTLWLANIFGTVMAYKGGKLTTDEYASIEHGDAVVALQTDSLGRLLIVCDRYVRRYDPKAHTLQQQNRESSDVYALELQETQPGERWSQPEDDIVRERMPQWVWWILAVLVVILSALLVYIAFLHRQRKRFISISTSPTSSSPQDKAEESSKGIQGIKAPWLQQAIALVEKNINNEQYSVEQLGNDLCMSRMTFYRKIQSATGQKPSEFMRTIRLRHAAELLRQDSMSISEISYATGFTSVSYFSRCFRSLYGVSPSQYVKDQRKA